MIHFDYLLYLPQLHIDKRETLMIKANRKSSTANREPQTINSKLLSANQLSTILRNRFLFLILISILIISGLLTDISFAASGYQVGPGDELLIKVFDNPDLSGTFTVDDEGALIYPLLGKLTISKKNAIEINFIITSLLKNDYLHDPIVDIRISRYRSKPVKIIGNSMSPKVVYLEGETRLIDLLATEVTLSIEPSKIINGKSIRILRHMNEGELEQSAFKPNSTIEIDLHKLFVVGDKDTNIILKGNDIIYLPQTMNISSVHIIGEVLKPGSIPYEKNLTVLMAITKAGGPTKRASTKNTVVKRIKNGQEVKINVKMGDKLDPEDIIEVPVSFW